MATQPFDKMPEVMRRYAGTFEKNASALITRCATAAGDRVVRGTPVDKGKARSNWIASLNAGVTYVIPPYAPGSHLGRGERRNLSAAVAQIKSVSERFHINRHRSIHIVNNVDYIGKLNQGSSPQAPPGFVQLAFRAALNVARRARLLR